LTRIRRRGRKFEPMIDYKYPTIASGATPNGSAGRAPDDVFSWILQRWRREKLQESSLLLSGASFYWSRLNNPNILCAGSVKQDCDIWLSSCVIATKLECRDWNISRSKTPGFVLCGPVYAHGCALLVCICVYDAKKILVDALGTLRTTGTHSL
jgi:hypothetical protein